MGGLEQNPAKASQWARLAREQKKVMQFLKERRYIAVVVDGKVQLYGKAATRLSTIENLESKP